MVGMTQATAESVDEGLLCHLTQVVYSGLGFCGCGWPDEGLALTHELLTAFSWGFGEGIWQRRDAVITRLLPTDGVRHIVLSTLDHAKLIEHGSSILGSWLTPRGKWWMYAVETVGGIEGLSRRFDEPGIGYPHTGEAADAGQECTDACWAVPDGWEPAPELVPKPIDPVVFVPCPGPSCVSYQYGADHQHTKRQS